MDTSAAPDTPGTPYVDTWGMNLGMKLSFENTFEEYEQFVNKITSVQSSASDKPNTEDATTPLKNDAEQGTVDPQAFLAHLDNLRHLESRLNYRFLEMDAKLRFLRLLTAGTEISNEEMTSLDTEIATFGEKTAKLDARIEGLKKNGKSLRKKISKCYNQTEIRRCIEGKPVLESEINNMYAEIRSIRSYFKENGLEDNEDESDIDWASRMVNDNLIGYEMLENQLNKIELELHEMDRIYDNFLRNKEMLSSKETEIDDELSRLELEKEELLKTLHEAERNCKTEEDLRKIDTYNMNLELVKIWESI